jgi:hypothetical protein
MGIKIASWCLQNVMTKHVKDMEYVKTNHEDLFIPTNNSFKDQVLKSEMVLARLSSAEVSF